MPSTRRQKVKARRSREADILSDVKNMDIFFGNPNLVENRLDFDLMSERSFRQTRDTNSQENEIRTAENTNDLRIDVNMSIS